MTAQDTYRAFNRAMLRSMHQDVKALHPKVDLRRALAAIRTDAGRQWFVEGSVAGERLQWTGRAEDAAHAKYQAWAAYLRNRETDQNAGD